MGGDFWDGNPSALAGLVATSAEAKSARSVGVMSSGGTVLTTELGNPIFRMDPWEMVDLQAPKNPKK